MIPSSRDIVLQRIRTALAVSDAPMPRAVGRNGWARPQVGTDLVAAFVTKATANLCTIGRVPDAIALPAAVEETLAEHGFDGDISIAPSLAGLTWPSHWRINFGAGRRTETVALTDVTAGIAETGSLVVCSGADRPAGLNFLPDLHIAVLDVGRIVAHLEDAWPQVRALPVWPRAINIISGPSRTADVAQIVVRPAHGPKALHILLVEAA
jgi:L-lactate dehydrogenase complex protein LldG